ncbi:MAG: LacI family DNA-binding transcriptional regulator [Anaerolineaceae bacterium]|nr:LacI family DNA-binding transcriptional regulator [Anaerolineaceae bacterium]
MPITILEIAKAAGCSVSTVSRALNSSDHAVNDDTKQRILAIADQLGYHPNLTARGLKMDRTFTIGLIVYNIASVFTPVLIRGIQEYLKQNDYFSIIISTDWDPELESKAVQQLISRSIDGVIFVETWRDESNNKSLDLAKKPYVYVYRLFNGEFANSVNVDDRYGAGLAVEHLVKLGHRRIGFINGPQGWDASKERLAGYQAVLAQYAIPYDPLLVKDGTWEVQSGYPATKSFLDLSDRPTAIFAANDLMALGAIYAAQDAGLNVPKDIAVVGYDNRDIASFSNPTITTVCPPSFEMGQLAAQMMLERLENQTDEVDPVRVKGRLIVRESSGADLSEVPPECHISHTIPPESLIRKWRGKNLQE